MSHARISTFLSSAAVCLALCPPAAGANIVVNGGFEAGDWQVPGSPWVSTMTMLPDRFDFRSDFSGIGGSKGGGTTCYDPDYWYCLLYQDLPTVPGAQYRLTFWANSPWGPGQNHLYVYWNTAGAAWMEVYSLQDLPVGAPFTQYVLNGLTATAAATRLRFHAGSASAGALVLDDISVEQVVVPEPSSAALFAGGALLTFFAARRRGTAPSRASGQGRPR